MGVLLKEYDERGFVFYTNYNSKKSKDLTENPKAALCMYWEELFKQIRIEGAILKVTDEQSDKYFDTRSEESRIGAHASKQSQPLEKYSDLQDQVKTQTDKFQRQELKRPSHWGGWRVVPHTIEFWIEGKHRLHKRVLFTRDDMNKKEWKKAFLNP